MSSKRSLRHHRLLSGLRPNTISPHLRLSAILAVLAVLALVFPFFPLFAEETPVVEQARKAIVEGVPTQQPYNGCLLVRFDASTTSKILGFVKNGDVVVIEEMNGLWARISSPEKGYCWASYLKVTETQPVPANQPQSLPTLLEISDPAKRLDHLEKGKHSLPTANFSAIATLTVPPTGSATIPEF